MNYNFSIMELPVAVSRIEVSFAPDTEQMMCINCGFKFPLHKALSVVTHALKVRKSGVRYDQRGAKVFEKKVCPVCKSHHLAHQNPNPNLS